MTSEAPFEFREHEARRALCGHHKDGMPITCSMRPLRCPGFGVLTEVAFDQTVSRPGSISSVPQVMQTAVRNTLPLIGLQRTNRVKHAISWIKEAAMVPRPGSSEACSGLDTSITNHADGAGVTQVKRKPLLHIDPTVLLCFLGAKELTRSVRSPFNHTVYYEDLQREPGKVMSRLAAYLGVNHSRWGGGGLRKSTPEDLKRLLVNFNQIAESLKPYPCLKMMLLEKDPARFDDPCSNSGLRRCGSNMLANVRLGRREYVNATHITCYIWWNTNTLQSLSSGSVANANRALGPSTSGIRAGRNARVLPTQYQLVAGTSHGKLPPKTGGSVPSRPRQRSDIVRARGHPVDALKRQPPSTFPPHKPFVLDSSASKSGGVGEVWPEKSSSATSSNPSQTPFAASWRSVQSRNADVGRPEADGSVLPRRTVSHKGGWRERQENLDIHEKLKYIKKLRDESLISEAVWAQKQSKLLASLSDTDI